MSTLVVVDGPNLVNRVGEFLTKQAPSKASVEVQRAYFQHYFDIDRLVTATIGANVPISPWHDLGTVIFHSNRGLGPSRTPLQPYSIRDSAELTPFWTRQGSNPNTATMLVDIPGGPSGSGENKEKGTDMSIAVYLFETMDRWDTAIIFSNDTDFVPAVWSLRRKGKRVHCASLEGSGASPLAAACQHFFPLNLEFLVEDRELFEIMYPGADLDAHFRASMKEHDERPSNPMPLPTRVRLLGRSLTIGPSYNTDKRLAERLMSGPLAADQPQPEMLRLVTYAEVLEGVPRHLAFFSGAIWPEMLALA